VLQSRAMASDNGPQSPANAAEAALPVHVLTGFLGSGKTTLLNRALRTPRFADAAVLINEFGDVAIDHLLVREAREELVVLASGCVCCTLRRDLVEQLTQLLEQRAKGTVPRFSRVVLETTGLADPAPIVQTLVSHATLRDQLYLDGIVCAVDAQLGLGTLRTRRIAQKQVAVADRLLLTKCDLASTAARAPLEQALRGLNPRASVLAVTSEQDASALLSGAGHLDTREVVIVAARAAQKHLFVDAQPHSAELEQVGQFALTLPTPVDFRSFSLWVSLLTQLWAERILRLKAVISARGERQPIAVQAVQHVVYPPLDLPPMPELAGKSHVVLLIQDLTNTERAELQQSLMALCAE
jgi:G3E family GTPase